MRKTVSISGMQVLGMCELIDMFRGRVDNLGNEETYSVKISVNCLVDGAWVVAEIFFVGGGDSDDYAISGEIMEMVSELRENGGGVVSRNIDNIFVFGERMFVELSLEIPHAN